MTRTISDEQQRKMQAGKRRKKSEREREREERIERVISHYQKKHGRPRRARGRRTVRVDRSLVERTRSILEGSATRGGGA